MSIPEKQWGLEELPEKGEDIQIGKPSINFSFTKEDSDAIYEELFSGKNGKEAKKIVTRILFDLYEDEKEKEDLLSRFSELTKDAVDKHLRTRGGG